MLWLFSITFVVLGLFGLYVYVLDPLWKARKALLFLRKKENWTWVEGELSPLYWYDTIIIGLKWYLRRNEPDRPPISPKIIGSTHRELGQIRHDVFEIAARRILEALKSEEIPASASMFLFYMEGSGEALEYYGLNQEELERLKRLNIIKEARNYLGLYKETGNPIALMMARKTLLDAKITPEESGIAEDLYGSMAEEGRLEAQGVN